ncbi:MAG: hypothetical protein IKD89_00370 [Clostridia bacterium]|nr:hypothetical protein [Clostridia bacterium]
MKKIIAILLAVMLLVAMAAVPASAASVVASSQNLSVNNVPADCDKYNIDGSNYFKLRDLAALLNGTESQFDVGWDAENGVIAITTGAAYSSPDGTELVRGADKSATAVPSSQTVMIDGRKVEGLSVWNIGGNNYFKLRDLGWELGFAVNYNQYTQTAMVFDVGVTAAEFLKAMAVNGGEVTTGGNLTYIYGEEQSETTEMVYIYGVAYVPEIDYIIIDIEGQMGDYYEYVAIAVPASLEGPYDVYIEHNLGGDIDTGSGEIDPASVGVLSDDDSVNIIIQSYTGDEAGMADVLAIANDLTGIMLAHLYSEVLLPNGFGLGSIGFDNTGL